MSVNSGRHDAERVVAEALFPMSYGCYGCPGSSSAAAVAIEALIDQPAILRDLLAITAEGHGARVG